MEQKLKDEIFEYLLYIEKKVKEERNKFKYYKTKRRIKNIIMNIKNIRADLHYLSDLEDE